MSIRILVVDDEEAISFAIREYFTARGNTVVCAHELEEAEALVNASEYDVVIGDLRLTGSHGAEGLDLISYVRGRSRARLVLLTAYGSAEVERAAFERGAHAVVQKPTPLAQLARLVTTLVNLKEQNACFEK